jgi:hypothetical protein
MVFLLFAGVRSSTPVIHPVFAGVRSRHRSSQCPLYWFLLRFRCCFLVQRHLVVAFVVGEHPFSFPCFSFSFSSSSAVRTGYFLWSCCCCGFDVCGKFVWVIVAGLYVFPQTSQSFWAYIKGRRMSALFRVWSTVRARGRRVSFVYLTSPLLCRRRQAFLSVFCSVSGLVCRKGYGVPGVFLLSLIYERRRTLSFIC